MTYVMSCDDFVFLFAWARGIKERNNQLNLPVNIFIAFLQKVSQTRLYLLEVWLIALIPVFVCGHRPKTKELLQLLLFLFSIWFISSLKGI